MHLKRVSKNSGQILLAVFLSIALVHAAMADGWNLKDSTGKRYSLADLHGKWVLVNFWAPWCPSCLQEMPELVAMQQQHKDLQLIGVAVMYEKRNEVLAAANKQLLPYPIVFGTEDTAASFGGLDALPTSFLYSPDGKLFGHHIGPLKLNDIEQIMAHKLRSENLFSR